ncbi:bifunctional metallophosphatase/5'-nucleotidase [Leptobacterium flavescens]|uniref:Bifunctional metallophosphatase/5'-nucleotidase n=1 Tax=Leptobacterium flavescens TaxID=472055 RepID=A0A6P0ULL1_9FLAO|nr:metallophosphatase [Leptobacterium flavescens]NER13300.1 bifunctional metallophosphatase/5'-nucleotidase [Leptobacterium flavescens]
MNRRNFIRNTAAGTTLLTLGGLPLSSCSLNSRKHITILHTNDVHSHIDALPPDDPRNPNQGGVSRRATLVEAIRKENPNTLLFDAGDIFQGTPYFNYYGGELEFKLMSMLKYDAATIGNHDFDNGIDGLYAQLPHASFDFLSANYDFSNTVMDTHVKPYKIFTVDGIRIGAFGLGIRLAGLVTQQLYKETRYLDPVETAQDVSRELKEEKQCDLVICLSHLGYSYGNAQLASDVNLAAQTENIDLIIGGHTHTFMDAPEIHTNRKGEEMLINQVGCYGINLGRIDFYFDKDKNVAATGKAISV